VKVLATGAMTTFKRNQTGVYCAETGIDEKDYWMLAHDKEH
jgi:hypothetical protein